MSLGISLSSKNSELQVMLDGLRAQYLASLPVKLAKLERTLDKGDEAHFRQAHRMAHNLQGTMASYGYAQLSAILRCVEDLLASPIAEEQTTALRDTIHQHLAQAQAMISGMQSHR
jgi:HPt (histidine-containing phosphotransfer) domain-containing protein